MLRDKSLSFYSHFSRTYLRGPCLPLPFDYGRKSNSLKCWAILAGFDSLLSENPKKKNALVHNALAQNSAQK